MANSPANRYDDEGQLVERAIASDVAGAPEGAKAVTGRPVDKPEPNSTFASRSKARSKAQVKQVDSDATENKAVAKKRTAKK